MTQLYKGYTSEAFGESGISYWLQAGEPRTVDGTRMVRLGHSLVLAEGWHADKGAAVLEVAARIEMLGKRLLAQAAKLRQEAAEEAAKKAVVTT